MGAIPYIMIRDAQQLEMGICSIFGDFNLSEY